MTEDQWDACHQSVLDMYDRDIGHLCYKGNSVAWWHSKAENYKDALRQAWDALKAAGVPCDGQTTVADGIRLLTGQRQAARKE